MATSPPQNGRFIRIRQVAPMCTRVTYASLDPTESISKAAYTLQRAIPFSIKIAALHGVLDPHLIAGSLGPPESTNQMASRLAQPFLQRSRS